MLKYKNNKKLKQLLNRKYSKNMSKMLKILFYRLIHQINSRQLKVKPNQKRIK